MLVPTLYQFFRRHVQRGFGEHGITEAATVDYVSDMLARFADTSALYPLRDRDDEPLERVAQFLVELQRAQGWGEDAPDRGREVALTRHLAEYALFMSGLFRDRLQARGQLAYYANHGRSAFRQSADYERNGKRAQVFRRLYFDFDRAARSLDHIRRAQFPLPSATENGPLVALWRM